MGKRKRGPETPSNDAATAQPAKKQIVSEELLTESCSLQIVTGSYDRILHGIIATIPGSKSTTKKVHFQDNFLFNAHASAIKCLALSPANAEDNAEGGKVILATGGTDERINLYSVSTTLPDGPSLPTLSSMPSLENPKNKELGTLFHHNSSVNVLYFPTRSKLISGSDDNTISISRTKDWTVLTTVKAPMPKVQGRPSGDTAPLGGTPAGVNDFAVHPSMKLMISVGKGEKCMRLWNLVTGKKANVLNFEKDLLQSVGEGKWSKGEGQKVVWNSIGDEFAIAFEKGVAIFGMDSEVKCLALPQPASKTHQIRYISIDSTEPQKSTELLALSTEDGRILFYSNTRYELPTNGTSKSKNYPRLLAVASLGGEVSGVIGRIKDFQILSPATDDPGSIMVVVTANSNGDVMIWHLPTAVFAESSKSQSPLENGTKANGTSSKVKADSTSQPKQVGTLIGQYNTGNRITCMQAFQLHGTAEGQENGLESDASDATSNEEEEETEQDEFTGFD